MLDDVICVAKSCRTLVATCLLSVWSLCHIQFLDPSIVFLMFAVCVLHILCVCVCFRQCSDV